MTEKEKTILKIANNTLYMADNSDYGSALWQILDSLGIEAEESDELEWMN